MLFNDLLLLRIKRPMNIIIRQTDLDATILGPFIYYDHYRAPMTVYNIQTNKYKLQPHINDKIKT